MSEFGCKLVHRHFDDHGQLPEIKDPFLRNVFLSRGIESIEQMDLSFASLLHYRDLKDIEKACDLLYKALKNDVHIIVVGDYDVDGATSTALAVRALRLFGSSHVDYFVPDRVSMGYGLSAGVVDLIRSKVPVDLIITVDNGITGFEGVKHAKELGIDVLVTDHHLATDEVPIADAIVNPNQKGCSFASKNLAGVGVIFYVMIALRAFLKSQGWFDQINLPYPNLSHLLDLVAVGSIADVVKLDQNNRIMIKKGLKQMQEGNCCQCFRSILATNREGPKYLTENDISYTIAPLLNAAGRIDNMTLGIECLLSDDPNRVKLLLQELSEVNRKRRDLEIQMRESALSTLECSDLDVSGLNSIVMYDPSYHQGIIGLVASQIKEKYYRPAVVFAKASEDELKGSVRSVCGLNIKDVLEEVSQISPDLLLRFGGHAMAAGMSIRPNRLNDFKEAFSKVISSKITPCMLEKTCCSDGELPADYLTLDFAQTLRNYGPWGNNFEYPIFDGLFMVQMYSNIRDRHIKLTVTPVSPKVHYYEFNAMVFNLPDEFHHLDLYHRVVRLCYRIEMNYWRGNCNLQLIVENMSLVDE